MKTAPVILIFLLTAVVVPAVLASNQSLSQPSPTDTPSSWKSQKRRLTRQLREALETAKQSNDRDLKQRLGGLTDETNALIDEISESSEAKDLPNRVGKLIEQLQPAQIVDDLSKLRTELTEQADRALQQALEAVEKSRRPELGPRVQQLREAFEQFKHDVTSADSTGALESLRETKLKELENQSANIVAEATGTSWTIVNVSVVIALIMVPLLFVVVVLFIILFQIRITNLQIGLNQHKDSIQTLTRDVKDAQVSVATLGANLNRELQELRQKIDVPRKDIETPAKTESIEPKTIEFEVVPPLRPVDTEPNFPSLVSDYLSQIGESRKRGVEAHFPTNILIPSSDQPAPFMLIANDDGFSGGIILPRAHLQRGQDYSLLYKLYYKCTEPSAGDVYILSPATVERFDTGWRLLAMGQMEIR